MNGKAQTAKTRVAHHTRSMHLSTAVEPGDHAYAGTHCNTAHGNKGPRASPIEYTSDYTKDSPEVLRLCKSYSRLVNSIAVGLGLRQDAR